MSTVGGSMAIGLLHLGLPVRDEGRSLRFYGTYFGFDPGGARRYPDGTVIVRNRDGFDLALHPGAVPDQLPSFLHFGFRLPGGDAVHELLARMEADGVAVPERWDEPGYVSFKCLDPDGWVVEVYWETVLPVSAPGPAPPGTDSPRPPAPPGA
jgi:catechol 2,3-dioxygenase-like lactoylglutathione lyase family enzyme